MRAIEWFGTSIVAACVLAFGVIFLDTLLFLELDFAILDGISLLGLPFIGLAGAAIASAARFGDKPVGKLHEPNVTGKLTSSPQPPSNFPFWIGMSGVLLGVILFLFCFGIDVSEGRFDLAMYDLGLASAPSYYNSGTEASATVVGVWALLFFGLPGALVASIGRLLRHRI